jgi:tetratricopeptide (TPR) repeat protein
MTRNATRAELEEAVHAEEKALAIREAVFGPDHDATAVVLNGLGMAYKGLGDAPRAVKLEERALAIDVRAVGPEHLNVATFELDLGMCLLELRRFDDALAHAQRGLAIRERQLGAEHPVVVEALADVAEIRLARRDAVEALLPLQRALAIVQKDPKSELLPRVQFLLARALVDTHGDRQRARALALQARQAYTPRAEVDAWLARHD